MIDIRFRINGLVSVDRFQRLLSSFTLGERRPVDVDKCLAGMLNKSNLMLILLAAPAANDDYQPRGFWSQPALLGVRA